MFSKIDIIIKIKSFFLLLIFPTTSVTVLCRVDQSVDPNPAQYLMGLER